MINLEILVSAYGYPALFIGTFLEGETILVIAGFLAHRGYLELPWVIVIAFWEPSPEINSTFGLAGPKESGF